MNQSTYTTNNVNIKKIICRVSEKNVVIVKSTYTEFTSENNKHIAKKQSLVFMTTKIVNFRLKTLNKSYEKLALKFWLFSDRQ